MQPKLAVTRKNLTESATPSQALHPNVKALSIEFHVDKPGQYEAVVDRRDNTVEVAEVPGKPIIPVFLYSHPNGLGGLRCVSGIIGVDRLVQEYAHDYPREWAKTAKPGDYLHDGRTLIVRTA